MVNDIQVVEYLDNGKVRVYEIEDTSTELEENGGYTTVVLTGKYEDTE